MFGVAKFVLDTIELFVKKDTIPSIEVMLALITLMGSPEFAYDLDSIGKAHPERIEEMLSILSSGRETFEKKLEKM